nr:hypothetical protein BC936DRAFT_146374 [Ipomoea batatas]
MPNKLTKKFPLYFRKNNTETLEIDNNEEDQHCGKQIGNVGKILPVESLSKSSYFVCSSYQKMEQSNNSTFKFSSTASINGCGTECFPDNIFTET